jgi:hypothetical protein
MTYASWACQRSEPRKPCDWDFAIASKGLNDRSWQIVLIKSASAVFCLLNILDVGRSSRIRRKRFVSEFQLLRSRSQ